MPRFMLIAAVWSFVVAPALCRAGALVACCTHNEPVSAAPACCDSHAAAPIDECPNTTPTERECGSCADVCKGIAKPAEERSLPALADDVQPWGGDATAELLTATGAPTHATFARVLTLVLPYPASVLPLRI